MKWTKISIVQAFSNYSFFYHAMEVLSFLAYSIQFQDIVADDSFELDWLFRLSFVTDAVKVSLQVSWV